MRLPFSFTGVELHAHGASSLRVRLASGGALLAADESGQPVVSLDSLVVREVSAAEFAGARDAHRDSLFGLDWRAVPSPPESAALSPEVVLFECGDAGPGVAGAHACAGKVLALLQEWLSDERFWVSPGVGHRGRGGGESWRGRAWLVSIAGMGSGAFCPGGESWAVRVGRCRSRAGFQGDPCAGAGLGRAADGRYAKARCSPPGSHARAQMPRRRPRRFDPEGTVLITGGTGSWVLVARHLVTGHGVRHLLLASRRGPEAEGASELQAQLEGLGAQVRIAACDVSERGRLEPLLQSVAKAHRSMRWCTSGALDDGVIGSLTAERMDGVLSSKADAAWHLHELTQQMDLQAFVLFSSAAGVLGSPGQGNYVAANAFLDALAAHRHARGLTATSLAWGLWEQTSNITGGLSDADRSRMARSGLRALPSEEGLELFDEALTRDEAIALAAPLDLAILRARARTRSIPALFNDLVRVPTRRAGEPDVSLAGRLIGAPESEREGIVLELVRSQVATVLGHVLPQAVDAQRAFTDLGFDSLTAVELRNRLNVETGLRLPTTLVFDYPTSAELAQYLLGAMSGRQLSVAAPLAPVGAFDEPLAVVGMSFVFRVAFVLRRDWGSWLSVVGMASRIFLLSWLGFGGFVGS